MAWNSSWWTTTRNTTATAPKLNAIAAGQKRNPEPIHDLLKDLRDWVYDVTQGATVGKSYDYLDSTKVKVYDHTPTDGTTDIADGDTVEVALNKLAGRTKYNSTQIVSHTTASYSGNHADGTIWTVASTSAYDSPVDGYLVFDVYSTHSSSNTGDIIHRIREGSSSTELDGIRRTRHENTTQEWTGATHRFVVPVDSADAAKTYHYKVGWNADNGASSIDARDTYTMTVTFVPTPVQD